MTDSEDEADSGDEVQLLVVTGVTDSGAEVQLLVAVVVNTYQ